MLLLIVIFFIFGAIIVFFISSEGSSSKPQKKLTSTEKLLKQSEDQLTQIREMMLEAGIEPMSEEDAEAYMKQFGDEIDEKLNRELERKMSHDIRSYSFLDRNIVCDLFIDMDDLNVSYNTRDMSNMETSECGEIQVSSIIDMYITDVPEDIKRTTIVKTSTDTKSMLSRAIIGSVIGGEVGALIGGVTANKTSVLEQSEQKGKSHYYLNITEKVFDERLGKDMFSLYRIILGDDYAKARSIMKIIESMTPMP